MENRALLILLTHLMESQLSSRTPPWLDAPFIPINDSQICPMTAGISFIRPPVPVNDICHRRRIHEYHCTVEKRYCVLQL